MVVCSGDDDWEAQKWNGWTSVKMYHVLVKMICIFDAEQTWINARKIAYGSNFVMAESDKGLNISNLPLMYALQNDQLWTHFISSDLYKDWICDNM